MLSAKNEHRLKKVVFSKVLKPIKNYVKPLNRLKIKIDLLYLLAYYLSYKFKKLIFKYKL